MKKGEMTDRIEFVAALLLVGIFAIMMIILFRQPGSRMESNNFFDCVQFEGEYSVDGSDWKPLTEDTVFDTEYLHTVRARGHFKRDIEKNQLLMLRIVDLKVTIFVNSQTVFRFGHPEQLPQNAKSGGNVWKSFTSSGIREEDYIEIELVNIYTDVHSLSFRQFFDEMYYGFSDNLYQKVLQENGLALLISVVSIMVGFLVLLAAIAQMFMKEKRVKRTFYSGGFILFAGFWFFIQFDILSLLIPFPTVNNTLDVLSAYFMCAFFSLYIGTYLSKWRKNAVRIVSAIALLAVAVVIMTTQSIAVDAYDLVPAGWCLAITNLTFSLVQLFLEYIDCKDRETRRFIISLIPIAVGVFLDFTGWFSGVNDTGSLRFCFLIFIMFQLWQILQELQESTYRTKQLKWLEDEMTQKDISIMLSQIQPHFLYNALNTIQYLCETQPKTAARVVENFSLYLRGNMDSLAQKAPIPFECELEHLEHYLVIEQLRFENIKIVYDLQATAFMLPALTIQPLVENSIRYGVRRRKGGGTVTISSWEDSKCWHVKIEDNGVGFNPEEVQYDGRSHIGISNTRDRLEVMCGASLNVNSQPGIGTTITITIPKEKMKYESNFSG